MKRVRGGVQAYLANQRTSQLQMLLAVSHFVHLGLLSLQDKVLDRGLVVEPSEIAEVSKMAENHFQNFLFACFSK